MKRCHCSFKIFSRERSEKQRVRIMARCDCGEVIRWEIPEGKSTAVELPVDGAERKGSVDWLNRLLRAVGI